MPTKNPIDPATVDRISGKRPNLLQRAIGAAVRYALPSGIAIEGWNPPGQVLPPVAQEEQGRLIDFPVGVNTQSRPRGNEGISFGQLRALADNYDLMRLVIERRKDQIEGLRWKITTTDPGDDNKEDSRVKLVTQFLRSPDKVHRWGPWIRMLVEELLVTDALTIYPRMTNGGDLYSLDIMDGTTIKPVVDNAGRRPLPPMPAYQQYVKGQPMATYSAEELLYLPRNPRANRFYGYSPVEQVIMTVSIALRRQVHQLNYYTEGNIPEALIPVPETWTPKNIRDFQKLWDAMNAELADKRKAKFIPNVKNVIFTKEPNLKDQMDEWLGRIICFAFAYPPSALTAQVNRATAETAQQTGEDEGLVPLMQTVKNILDDVILAQFGWDDIEFGWETETTLDPETQATVDAADAESGVRTIDECRTARGLKPYGIKGQTDVPPFLRELTPQQQAANDALAASQQNNAGKPGDKNPPSSSGKPGIVGKPGARAAAGDEGGPDVKKSAVEYVDDDGYARQEREALLQREEELAEAIAKAFESAVDDVVAAYDEKFGVTKAAVDEIVLMEFLDGVVIGLEGASKPLLKTLKATAGEGVTFALGKVGVDTTAVTNLANTRAGAYASRRAAELVNKSAKGGKLAESTRNMIRSTIAEAVEKGATNEAVAKVLRDSYAFSAKRAAAIAKTELRAADVAGNLAGYKESGVVTGKRWLLSNEPDVCAVCKGNAEQGVIPLDDEFSSGDQGAPAHPVCRCDIAPDVE
jgi:SPP1 gp7 family putative phage head morphogenesis protein